MNNALTIFDQPQTQVPAHLQQFLNENSNIEDRERVPSLSYEGKVWTISLDGEKTKLVKKDPETGDELPLQIMRVVVLDYAKRRGRAYYPGSYDPTKASMPECWSDDGIKPHTNVSAPKCTTCAQCPLAVKGSKMSDAGKAISACSQHRMLAVVPAQKMGMTPLRMKIAVTSDYDKESPEMDASGWFAFSQLIDKMRSMNVGHTASFVCKIKFDPNAAFPKLKFSPDRWLTPEELAIVGPAAASDETKARLAGTYTPNGVDGVDHTAAAPADEDDGLAAQAAANAAAAKAAADKAATEATAAAAEKAAKAAAAKAAREKAAAEKAAAEAAAAAAAKPVTGMVMDDDEDMDLSALGAATPASKPAAAAQPAATVTSTVSSDLGSLLSAWDE